MFTSFRRLRSALLGLAMLVTTAPVVMADGIFVQTEIGDDTRGVVASQTRGAWSVGGVHTRYEEGNALGLFLTKEVATWNGTTLKVGPSLAWTDPQDARASWQPGVKVAAERWTGFSTFGLFTLAEINTADHGWFANVQASHYATGLAVELSRGGSDTYHDTTLALRKRIGTGPFHLRIGHKFSSEDTFIGVTLNTF